MRNYNTMDAMWRDAVTAVMNNGWLRDSRAGKTKEVIGWSACLVDVNFSILQNPIRKLDPKYALAEVLWLLDTDSRIDMIKHYAPQYEQFANDGKAYGHYGRRLGNAGSSDLREVLEASSNPEFASIANQIQCAAALLKKNPNTRQCVINMWRSSDLAMALCGGCNDIPCTLVFQFIIGPEDQLHGVVTMRSNDLWLGMPYDIIYFSVLLNLMALEVGLKVGTLTHNVGSLHAYEKHWDKLTEAAAGTPIYSLPCNWNWLRPIGQQISIATRHEYASRKGATKLEWKHFTGTVFHEMHNVFLGKEPWSPAIKRLQDMRVK